MPTRDPTPDEKDWPFFLIQMSKSTSKSSTGLTGHDSGEDIRRHSRGMICPSLAATIAPKIQGRRECRALNRTRGLACSKNTRVSHHRYVEPSDIPCAMVLTAYTCSPRCTGLLATVRPGETSSPGLTPASGRQDHTIWSSVPAALVWRCRHVHRIPHPTIRDDRDTPLCWRRDGPSHTPDFIF